LVFFAAYSGIYIKDKKGMAEKVIFTQVI